MSILLNRQSGRNVVMYSPEGGVDIEEVAEQRPEKIFKEEIDPSFGVLPFQGQRIARNLGLSGKVAREMAHFVERLYASFVAVDASLFEINPVLKTTDDKIQIGRASCRERV